MAERSVTQIGGGPIGAGPIGSSVSGFASGSLAAVASDTITFSDSAVANITAVATASDTITFSDSAVGEVPSATPVFVDADGTGGEEPASLTTPSIASTGSNKWVVGGSVTGYVFGSVGDTTDFKYDGSTGTSLTQQGTDQDFDAGAGKHTTWRATGGPSGSTTTGYATYSGPPQAAAMAMAVYSDVDQTTPVASTADNNGTNGSASSLTISSGAVTTVAGQRVVSVFGVRTPNATEIAAASAVAGSNLRHSQLDGAFSFMQTIIVDKVATGTSTTVEVQLNSTGSAISWGWICRSFVVNGVSGSGSITADAADTITFSDSAVANRDAVASASDTVTLSDSAIANRNAVAVASDTLSLSDSAVAAAGVAASASDTITLSDSAVAAQNASASASDTITLSDSAIANRSAVAVASDSLTLTDSAVAAQNAVAVATDSITLSDSAEGSIAGGLEASASDTLTLSDSAVANVSAVATATDSISLSDSAVANRSAVATAQDSITLSDSAIANVQAVITAVATDSITLSDSAVASVQPPFSVPSIYGADEFPRKRRERRIVEDILEVIEELSPTKPAEVASAVRKVIAPARVEDYTAVLAALSTVRTEVQAIATRVIEEERQRKIKLRRRREEEFMLL